MPAPRRRSTKPANSEAAQAANTEAENTETTEEGGEEDAPKRTRTPKLYTVKDAELANSLVGDDFEDEIAEGDPVTPEMLDSMRSAKAKWDSPENGGIKHVFGMNSAIPLRNILNKWLAEGDEDGGIDIEDVDALYKALVDEGQGWVQLAARTGASIADVKAALKDKVQEEKGEDVDVTAGGRAYGKGENWRWVTAEELLAAKAENGNGSDEEGEESDEESDDDTSDEEESDDTEAEAPTPKPRRRTRTAS